MSSPCFVCVMFIIQRLILICPVLGFMHNQLFIKISSSLSIARTTRWFINIRAPSGRILWRIKHTLSAFKAASAGWFKTLKYSWKYRINNFKILSAKTLFSSLCKTNVKPVFPAPHQTTTLSSRNGSPFFNLKNPSSNSGSWSSWLMAWMSSSIVLLVTDRLNRFSECT